MLCQLPILSTSWFVPCLPIVYNDFLFYRYMYHDWLFAFWLLVNTELLMHRYSDGLLNSCVKYPLIWTTVTMIILTNCWNKFYSNMKCHLHFIEICNSIWFNKKREREIQTHAIHMHLLRVFIKAQLYFCHPEQNWSFIQ